MTGIDLMEGIDPVEFITSERVGFLHRFKGYALTLKRKDMTPRERLAHSRHFVHDMNCYRLPLRCCQFKLHGEAEGLLSVLLKYMDEAWDERNSPDIDMTRIADYIATSYSDLVDHLKQRPK
jgi:hypothetical protein